MPSSKTTYKPEKFRGRKVTFTVQNGRVWARCPSLAKTQFLGYGNNKTQAFEDCKDSMRTILNARAKKRRSKK